VLWLEWNSKSIEQRLPGMAKPKVPLQYDWLPQNRVSSIPKKHLMFPGTTSVEMGQVFFLDFNTKFWRRVHWIWKIDEWLMKRYFMHQNQNVITGAWPRTIDLWTSSNQGLYPCGEGAGYAGWDYLCHIDGNVLMIRAILNQKNRNRNLGFLKIFQLWNEFHSVAIINYY
jgi:hypothetical protein